MRGEVCGCVLDIKLPGSWRHEPIDANGKGNGSILVVAEACSRPAVAVSNVLDDE